MYGKGKVKTRDFVRFLARRDQLECMNSDLNARFVVPRFFDVSSRQLQQQQFIIDLQLKVME
jgi:hypothetical protein